MRQGESCSFFPCSRDLRISGLQCRRVFQHYEVTAVMEGDDMPRYYFHLRSKDQFIWDQEGVDLPDPASAKGAAERAAMELRGNLQESDPICCWTVAVTDESDELIHVTSL